MFLIDDAALLKIRHAVERHTKGVQFTDDTPLISGGILDSLAIVDILLDLERAFGIRVPAIDVQPDDFDSIRMIAGTLARLQGKNR